MEFLCPICCSVIDRRNNMIQRAERDSECSLLCNDKDNYYKIKCSDYLEYGQHVMCPSCGYIMEFVTLPKKT